MYLVVIHVPIYMDGDRTLVTTEWRRSLELLRDSFEGHFGEITVLAPRLDARSATPNQRIERMDDVAGVGLLPSFPKDCRARQYWTVHRRKWLEDIHTHLSRADVVHSGFCDVFKPINFTGHLAAIRASKPTVFVQDTDQVLQLTELAGGAGLRTRLRNRAYCAVYERCVRHGVATADLSLLKGSSVNRRYGPWARNAKDFEDTSFLSQEIVPAPLVERRVATLADERPLRLVYCGRLEPRKGIAESITHVAAARQLGARIELDLIGDGSQRPLLEAHVSKNGASQWVRFLGSMPYGPALLAKLSTYDAMLFTPQAEDTPRMIFDGFAAGLPLIGNGISYVRECRERHKAVLILPSTDSRPVAEELAKIDRDRRVLGELARLAVAAARESAADVWYKRRAEWTIEAVERHGKS